MARGHLFWHVPHWFEGAPAAGAGIQNVGDSMLAALVDEHDITHLGQDNFVVVRVIGQYQYNMTAAVALDTYIHSRVYVTTADSTTVALRDLDARDDADSSFLWHNIELYRTQQNNSPAGSWLNSSSASVNQPSQTRNGSFDITVNRRVEEGTAMVFHGQTSPGFPDNEFALKLWVRLLMREA